MLTTSACQCGPLPAWRVIVLFYASLFLPHLRSQRSHYMSRHLDRQTHLNITIGNQRSPFYRCEKEFRLTEGCCSLFNSQSTLLPYPQQSLLFNLGYPRSSRFVVPGETQSGLAQIQPWQPAVSQAPKFYHFPSAWILHLRAPDFIFVFYSQRLVFISLLLPCSNTFSCNSFVMDAIKASRNLEEKD